MASRNPSTHTLVLLLSLPLTDAPLPLHRLPAGLFSAMPSRRARWAGTPSSTPLTSPSRTSPTPACCTGMISCMHCGRWVISPVSPLKHASEDGATAPICPSGNRSHTNAVPPPCLQGGRPHELDPHTLETIGESRVLDDVIAKDSPLAAHYRWGMREDGRFRGRVPHCPHSGQDDRITVKRPPRSISALQVRSEEGWDAVDGRRGHNCQECAPRSALQVRVRRVSVPVSIYSVVRITTE